MLVSCATQGSVKEMEADLNLKIGTEYDKENWRYFHIISKTSSHNELEHKREDGCSYAFMVNKNTNIIESWRFTLDKSFCKAISKTDG